MTHDHPLSYRPRAFTLIELLVVISIIALLIGILLPALGAARFSAREIRCATQLQQLGRAVFTYTADADGFFPPITDPGAFPGVPGNNITWDDFLGLGGYDGRSGRSTFTNAGGFFAVGFQVGSDLPDAPVYVCPLDQASHALFGGTNVRSRTYAMNERGDNLNIMGGISTAPFGGRGSSLRVSDVTQGSNTIMLGENLSTTTPTGNTSDNVLGHRNGARIWGFIADPASATIVPRVFKHHLRGDLQTGGALENEYNNNYLFTDGHVVNLSNAATIEGQPTAGNYSNTMWDAQQ